MYQVPCDAGTYSDKPGSVSSHLYLNFSHFGVHMIFYIFLPTFLTYILIFSYLLTYPHRRHVKNVWLGMFVRHKQLVTMKTRVKLETTVLLAVPNRNLVNQVFFVILEVLNLSFVFSFSKVLPDVAWPVQRGHLGVLPKAKRSRGVQREASKVELFKCLKRL